MEHGKAVSLNTASTCRIAVICVAYLGDPDGVRRLAQYFGVAGARLYVHVDAKTDIAPYRTALAPLPHVALLETRHQIYWGGFTLVQAVIDAIRAARAEADYDRYCLITEDSVPLIDTATFCRLMALSDQFMHLHPVASDDIWQRYRGFYLFDCAAMNPRSPPADRIVEPDLIATLQRLDQLRTVGKFAIERLYHGATWWALTWQAIDEILLHWDHSAHMRISFEFSMIPEEQYFHTILGNAVARFSFRPFMFTDFTREPRPFVYRSLAELIALRTQPTLFARKAALDSEEVTRFVGLLCGEAWDV